MKIIYLLFIFATNLSFRWFIFNSFLLFGTVRRVKQHLFRRKLLCRVWTILLILIKFKSKVENNQNPPLIQWDITLFKSNNHHFVTSCFCRRSCEHFAFHFFFLEKYLSNLWHYELIHLVWTECVRSVLRIFRSRRCWWEPVNPSSRPTAM